MLGIKIIVFYRTDAGVLQKYQTSDTPQSKTVFLYLHDGHYYGIANFNAFLGEAYVCQFCHTGYSNRRDHACKYSCDMCNDSECHKRQGRSKYCNDCRRYCKSDFCFKKHKQVMSTNDLGASVAPCDVTKYCKDCNRCYHVSVKNPKPHKCVTGRCVHCGEEMLPDVKHACYIQPIKPKKNRQQVYFL